MAARRLKVVFFGTAEFAVPSLESLIAAGHDILTVVTQPDKPQGRGRQLGASPVKMAALKHSLPLMQPRRVRAESFLARMREFAPDVLALAAFGQIVPQALLDLPPLGPINVHGSLLPRYRGAAPIQRAIMAGETEIGVTTMWMDATLDTGDILLTAGIPIEPTDNSGSLFPKLAQLGAGLLVETLARLADGTLVRKPQDHAQATLAPALQPDDGAVRWDETAQQINNRIRGVTPKPGAFAQIERRRVKVWAAQDAAIDAGNSPPGTVVGFSKSPPGLLVAAGANSVLRITEAQPENGKRMDAAAWARGLRLAAGSQFETWNPDNESQGRL